MGAPDDYLRSLSEDSERWQRLGPNRTRDFVEGALEALVESGALTPSDAQTWKTTILASLDKSRATFRGPPEDSPPGVIGATRPTFARFEAMIPVHEPAQIILGVRSVQILGIELYDTKLAIDWRLVPLSDAINQGFDPHAEMPGGGQDSNRMLLTDNVGTVYSFFAGNSGGRLERVGRSEYRPAPPAEAHVLHVQWGEFQFDLRLPDHHGQV